MGPVTEDGTPHKLIQNSLPPGKRVGLELKPFTGKHKRQHLQIKSPHLDFVMSVLENGTQQSDPLKTFLAPEHGKNYVETPCTEVGGLAHALDARQRLDQSNRPWIIDKRHANGFKRSLRKLNQILVSIIRRKEVKKPDWRTRSQKYSGAKRRHYEQCAAENELHPLGTKDGAPIFHDGAVKWGEISARPRALLVQSVRAKGAPGVKPGTVLRSPIMIEGGYRDLFEDALHHFCHRRGFHFVASGMDLHKRGRKIRSMVEAGDEVLSCDWSSFDGSLGWLGVWEREGFYECCVELFGEDTALKLVLETQNFCKVQAGPLRAEIFGNRGSGTAGTSTGNKLVVLAALFYCLGPAMLGSGAVKLFCDGDDTLIIVPKRWQGARWYRSWSRRLTELGLETKIEQCLLDASGNPAVDRLRFCRAGVVDTARGPFLCKIPQDALKVATNIRRHFRGPQFLDYMQTLCVGMTDVYGDVPILCEMGPLFDVGAKVDKELLDNAGLEYMLKLHSSGKAGVITKQHRLSFERTYGVAVDLQLRCESALRQLSGELHQLLRFFRA